MKVRMDFFVVVSIIVPGIPNDLEVERKDIMPVKKVIIGSRIKVFPD